MQCTSYVPVYYHARDLNSGANGYSWHLFNNNTNFGEERSYNISLPPSTKDQYLNYDKEVLSRVIQNQEATFRYQVQELHRLYKRQKELMDETRTRQIISQHLLSQTSESIHCFSDISQTSHAPSWLFGHRSHSKFAELAVGNIQERETSYNEVKSLSSNFKENEKRILDLKFPADVYHEYEQKPAKLENTEKRICLIDLNEEPTQMEIMHDDPCDGRSDGVDTLLVIDLNSMPVDCFSETEIKLENNSVEDTKSDVKFLKVTPDEPSPLLLNSTVKSTKDTILVGPVSPENEECSPPRGESEDIIQHEGETLFLEIDTNAAETLLKISSSDGTQKLKNCLFWFAEIVSDLETSAYKTKNDQNPSHVDKKEKSKKRRARRDQFKGFAERGSISMKRNAGKKGFTKGRKSISSILKQPSTRSSYGVLQSWGKIKKREGRRRRASKFVVIS